MDYLVTLVLAFFVRVIGWVPFGILYPVSDAVSFLLYHVLRYRRRVVEENLRNSFPNLSEKELKKLVRGSYRNLADIFVEGIKGFTMSESQYTKRFKILNPQILDPYKAEKKSVIIMPAHYGNWEWGTGITPSQMGFKHTIIIYKPLSNKPADRFFKKHRAHADVIMGSIYETLKLFRKYADDFSIFVMVSDQSPPPVAKKVYWTDFLGRKTAFIRGAELFAKQYEIPVFYMECQRVKRGFYELTFSLITENAALLPDGEMTKRYAAKLEKTIRKKPENWLWSHRRWKLKQKN